MGRVDNKVVFIWGALPGEEVEYRVIKNKKNYVEGVAEKVLTRSPQRIAPLDEHFLSCSPWQIINIKDENEWKKKIALETYLRLGQINLPSIEVFSDNKDFGYRNKMEFSFALSADGKVSLGLFKRGSHRPSPVPGCELASKAINETGKKIIEWLNSVVMPIRSLKSVIIRSNTLGQSAAALFIKDRPPLIPLLRKEGIPQAELLVGLQIYYSDHRCPASRPDELLYSAGQNYLIEQINGVKFKYGLLSFFQVNAPVFSEAIKDIKKFIEPNSELLDYYSGVGAIGLSVGAKANKITLVENNTEAVSLALENIKINKIGNATASCCNSEKLTEVISQSSVVIVDPPRTGLDKKFVDQILRITPKRIIYLSCDLGTQARDLALLFSKYKPVFWRIYNFFPHTPHIEGLCVLELV